jgi:recombination protein RecA
VTPADVSDVMTRGQIAHPQEFIPTGSLGIDLALGGGWPVGHTSELSGPPDSGKSTLVDYAIVSAQKTPLAMAGLIDTHGTFNHEYAKRVGVDLSRLVLARSLNYLPQFLGFCSLVVVDPLLEVAHAEFLNGTTVLYTTELRRNLGRRRFGPVVRTGSLNETSACVSLRCSLPTTTFTVETAAFGRPYARMTGKFDILDQGIYHALEVLDWAVALGAVQKKGNWYQFTGWNATKINGRGFAARWLAMHPLVLDLLETQIRYGSMV